MNELFVNTWQNTGMKNQPIWVFQTETPDGTLGNYVGDYVALSADMRRAYHLDGLSIRFPFGDEKYIPVDDVDEEAGLTRDGLLRQFVEYAEKVFVYGRCFCYFKEVAEALVRCANAVGYKWILQEGYDSDTHEDVWTIYAEWFAERANIGKNVIYCFSKESVEEALNEYEGSSCDMELHDVIMEYPDGYYEEDEAYVVILNRKEV